MQGLGCARRRYIILRSRAPLPAEARARIHAAWEQVFPGVKAIVAHCCRTNRLHQILGAHLRHCIWSKVFRSMIAGCPSRMPRKSRACAKAMRR